MKHRYSVILNFNISNPIFMEPLNPFSWSDNQNMSIFIQQIEEFAKNSSFNNFAKNLKFRSISLYSKNSLPFLAVMHQILFLATK